MKMMHACLVLTSDTLCCCYAHRGIQHSVVVITKLKYLKVLYNIDAAATLIHCRQYVTKYVHCHEYLQQEQYLQISSITMN